MLTLLPTAPWRWSIKDLPVKQPDILKEWLFKIFFRVCQRPCLGEEEGTMPSGRYPSQARHHAKYQDAHHHQLLLRNYLGRLQCAAVWHRVWLCMKPISIKLPFIRLGPVLPCPGCKMPAPTIARAPILANLAQNITHSIWLTSTQLWGSAVLGEEGNSVPG